MGETTEDADKENKSQKNSTFQPIELEFHFKSFFKNIENWKLTGKNI